MLHKKLLTLLFCVIGIAAIDQKKQVCFTYDDLPVVGYVLLDSIEMHTLTEKLIRSIKQNNIPAVGFVNEGKLFRNGVEVPYQVAMLKLWPANQLELGNHTYSHPDYNQTTFTTFAAGILNGEKVTRRLLNESGLTLRYFRHPFLHMGDSKEKADSLNNFLAEHDYTIAPVTIDNDDYLFALAYARAASKKDIKLMKQIGADYITYMEKKVLYFEQQSEKLFGRTISQILLLHGSQINADYTDALAKMFIRNGYSFISMEDALKDQAYTTEISVFGKWGISWLDRWALSAGKTKDFFKDEPATPAHIVEMAR